MPIYQEYITDKKTGKKVEKLIDGKKVYYIRTYVTDEFGNSKQVTRHNKTWIGKDGKKLAELEEAKLISTPSIEIFKQKKITLHELKEKYLSFLKGKVDDDTLHNKEVLLSHFCDIDETKQVKTYPNSLISSWNVNQFTIWQKEMKQKEYEKSKNKWTSYSIEHLNRIYGEICKMIDYAITEGLCSLNFAKQTGKIGTPKEIKMSTIRKKYNVINFKEFTELLRVSKDNLKYNVYFDLSFTRGPRPGEIRAFRVCDYCYEKKQLMVNHTLSKSNELKEPKTVASKAIIDLDDSLNEKINKLINILKQKKNFNDKWYIFGGKNPISSNSLTKAKKKYFKLARIEKHLRLHDFRHSCATWLFSIGIPITVISKILRHKNINETMRTYTHMLQDDYTNSIKKINSLIKEV